MDKKENPDATGLDITWEKILPLSLAVQDAEKTARRFTDIFGISWRLHDLQMEVLGQQSAADL